MPRPLARTFALITALCVVAACAQRADPDSLAADVTVPPATQGTGDADPGDGRRPAAASDAEALVDGALVDVESYWAATFPRIYGAEFEPLAGYHPYGPGTDVPPCGDSPPDYEMIAGNAFYCPTDDLLAWDVTLVDELNEAFGPFTIGIVFSHELAHAAQARAAVQGRTIDLELQADCFAGGWTAHVGEAGSDTFDVDAGVLDASVAGMLAISDAPGILEDDPMAHGSGFDRIGAFQDGYENGAQRCAAYEGAPRRTVEFGFGDAELGDPDAGDMPLRDGGPEPGQEGLLTLVEVDLNEFFGWALGELGASWTPVGDLLLVDPAVDQVACGGETLRGDELAYAALYCVDENVAVIDGAGLVPELYEIGDFAVASEIARLYAFAAQTQLGVDGAQGGSLQADCLTGAWAASTFPAAPDVTPGTQLQISPGDLDEAIMGFLTYGRDGGGDGTVFDRTDALRTGVLEGHGSCDEHAPLG